MTELDLNSVRPSRRPATKSDLWSMFRAVRDALLDRAVVKIVPTVEDLPANAPATHLYRVATPVAERANLYMGTGPSTPLVKITGTPVQEA